MELDSRSRNQDFTPHAQRFSNIRTSSGDDPCVRLGASVVANHQRSHERAHDHAFSMPNTSGSSGTRFGHNGTNSSERHDVSPGQQPNFTMQFGPPTSTFRSGQPQMPGHPALQNQDYEPFNEHATLSAAVIAQLWQCTGAKSRIVLHMLSYYQYSTCTNRVCPRGLTIQSPGTPMYLYLYRYIYRYRYTASPSQ